MASPIPTRPWMPWHLLPLLLLLLTACADLRRLLPSPQGPQGSRSGAAGPSQRAAPDSARQLQRHLARERCLRERPVLEAQMAELRRSEARLARVKEESYGSPSSPPRWDEDEESRFRLEDREADWQKYLQAREDWTRQESGRRARWEADHAGRLQEAQGRLDQIARSLRNQHADLFTAPGSIEFNSAAIRRLRDCDG